MPHTLDLNKLPQVFEAIEENNDRLSKWELGFFSSVSDQYERTGKLSDDQLEHLEKIYIRRVP